MITNVGPVHLELLGTVEAIAEAKAEILAGLGADGRAVVPADAEALEPHLADELRHDHASAPAATCSRARRARPRATDLRPTIVDPGRRGASSSFPFAEAHNLTNAACAVAIGVALGADLGRDGPSGAGHSLLAPAGRAGPSSPRAPCS